MPVRGEQQGQELPGPVRKGFPVFAAQKDRFGIPGLGNDRFYAQGPYFHAVAGKSGHVQNNDNWGFERMIGGPESRILFIFASFRRKDISVGKP